METREITKAITALKKRRHYYARLLLKADEETRLPLSLSVKRMDEAILIVKEAAKPTAYDRIKRVVFDGKSLRE